MKFRFRPDKGKEMGFTPDDIDDFEIAKQKVCNLLDTPGWEWLAPAINEGELAWAAIMDLVASHLE